MIWIQFKLMARSLMRNKLHTGINIIGLAIAIALALILSAYIANEVSVDSFHENKSCIYRVYGDVTVSLAPPFGQYILDNAPEAKAYTRIYRTEEVTISYKAKTLNSGNCLLVDSTFFTMFSFPLLAGEPAEVLASKDLVVLSRTFAVKLFGKVNPVGQQIAFDKEHHLTVSGIFDDFKDNTHGHG